jgi:hypothetical protein
MRSGRATKTMHRIERLQDRWDLSGDEIRSALRTGAMKGIRLGRRWLIPDAEVRRIEGCRPPEPKPPEPDPIPRALLEPNSDPALPDANDENAPPIRRRRGRPRRNRQAETEVGSPEAGALAAAGGPP